MKPIHGTLLALVLTGGLALAVSANHDSGPGLLPYEHPEAVALGAAIYADHCAACHGADLSGQPGVDWRVRDADGYLPAPPHDATGHTWHHPDDVLIAITALGTEALVGNGYRSAMMGFADVLSEAEILAVLAYIKSTWPEEVIAVHNQINAQAAAAR
jgi:mono/diheme cytochrome c family protein